MCRLSASPKSGLANGDRIPSTLPCTSSDPYETIQSLVCNTDNPPVPDSGWWRGGAHLLAGNRHHTRQGCLECQALLTFICSKILLDPFQHQRCHRRAVVNARNAKPLLQFRRNVEVKLDLTF